VGLHDHGEWLNVALENMRKGEYSVITLKHIGWDETRKSKTQSFTYWGIGLLDWTTVVDLDQDFNYMKTIVQRGTGNIRYKCPDEVTCKGFIVSC